MNDDLLTMVRHMMDAWNDHDVERVVQYFADDAKVRPLGISYAPSYVSGKENIRKWLSDIFSMGFHIILKNLREIGDTVIWNGDVHVDMLANLGLETIPVEYEAAFADGKIHALAARMSDEGLNIVREVVGDRTSAM